MKKGFTFLELIIVVALIMILGGAATGYYARFYSQNTVNATADQLSGSFHKAQLYSLVSRQGTSWGVHNGTNQFVLFSGSTYAGRNQVFDEVWNVNPSISIGGFTDIIFNRVNGLPNLATMVTVTGGNNSQSVIINSQGGLSR